MINTDDSILREEDLSLLRQAQLFRFRETNSKDHPKQFETTTMFNNNSVSISVSDDESNDLNRIRARTRRKRKKVSHRTSYELPRHVLRLFVRYWVVLVFLLAVGLLVFESTRIGFKSSDLKKPDLNGKESPSKKNEGNLNRLDPTTKVIGGVRQRKLD